jgi:hypothetical protein
MIRNRKSLRRTCHNPTVRAWRTLTHSTVRALPGYHRGPDDLSQALTAFARAIRCHRRLAKLAPSFFDEAVRQRELENREEQRRWMELWEPCLARVYGEEPHRAKPDEGLPRLPHTNTQRAVDRRLNELTGWLALGQVALERHRRRNPYAWVSLTRLARLMKIAFDFKRMVLGLDSPNPLPDKITHDYAFTDLQRAYGDKTEAASPSVEPASSPTVTMAPPVLERLPNLSPSAPMVMPVAPGTLMTPRCDAYSRLTRRLCSAPPAR